MCAGARLCKGPKQGGGGSEMTGAHQLDMARVMLMSQADCCERKVSTRGGMIDLC